MVPDPNDFDADTMHQALLDFPIHDQFIEADDTTNKPEKLTYESWTDWQDSFVIFLKNTKSVNKSVPLYYVIRKEPNPIAANQMTEEDDIVYNAPHTGGAFIRDNTYLNELTNGTDAD